MLHCKYVATESEQEQEGKAHIRQKQDMEKDCFFFFHSLVL